MIRTIVVANILLLSACATALTSEGTGIRVVDDKSANSCKFIGTVSGFDTFSPTVGHESENAMNEARNKAAALGANGIKIVHMQTTIQGTSVTAEALPCQFTG